MAIYSKNGKHSIIEPSGRGKGHTAVDHHNPRQPTSHNDAVARVSDYVHTSEDQTSIARQTSGKHIKGGPVPIHSGMATKSETGIPVYGGDHRSAVDSLTGTVVVPGKDGSIADHVLTKVPDAKNFGPVPTTLGHRAASNRQRARSHNPLLPKSDADDHALGKTILDEATKSGGRS